MILTLQTKSFGCYGGIPTYNRLVCRVLNDLNWGVDNCVLVAMDNHEVVEREASYANVRIEGFGGYRIKFILRAVRAVVTNEVELLLAGHINYGPLSLLLSWLRPSLRYGVFIYGSEVWERMPLFRRWALQRADFIISISDYTIQQAVKINGIRKQRTFLLPNAVEWATHDHCPSSDALPSEGLKLLSVGRFHPTERRKGFDTVIESLPSIARSVPNVQYIIIGNGADLDRHKVLAEKVGVADRVHFLGNVDEETLRSCYKSCDIFVMPSAQEGFGFVYLEAMQYSKPIVAANSGGVPEVVQDGVNGLLVEYGNVHELTDALTRLCLNPNLRERLGSAGFERLSKRFTFSHFQRSLVDILETEKQDVATRAPVPTQP